MDTSILTVGSVTYAMKARKALLRAGVESSLVKVNVTESGMLGCRHGVEISNSDFYTAVAVLRDCRIDYQIYSGDKVDLS